MTARPAPKVVQPEKVQGLIVEEQLVKLILELNPSVRIDAGQISQGKKNVPDVESTLQHVRAAESSGTVVTAESVATSGSFDPLTADYGDEENIRKLIALLPSPMSSSVNPIHRERLLRIFERYAKYRLPTVSQILRRYAGNETALFESLVQEYGPEPNINDYDYFHEGIPPLPDGWARMESSRGDIYYKYLPSGNVSWTRPKRSFARDL